MRLVDDGDIVADADIHGLRIAIVLIGNIECIAARTDIGDKGGVASRTKGPDAIGAGEDGQRANARRCADRQTGALGIHNPVGGIAPVGRQVITQQMPLLPRPPDAIAPGGIGAGAEGIRVAIRRIKRLTTAHIHRWRGMIQHRLSMDRGDIQ